MGDFSQMVESVQLGRVGSAGGVGLAEGVGLERGVGSM